MENKQHSKVTVRCDAFGGLTIYAKGRRVSERGLSVWSAGDALEEMGFAVDWDELPRSEGLRVTFAR